MRSAALGALCRRLATGSSGATTTLNTHPPQEQPVMKTFALLDEHGRVLPGAVLPPELTPQELLKAYRLMVRSSVMDLLLYESQRQGRISFYLTAFGEEAAVMGSAMALQGDDEVLAQYREVGLLLWRGYTLEQVCDQCFSSADDPGKGRMMPVHYGYAPLHFQTISSPLGTQIPQAAGVAYAHKLGGTGRVAVCYFGDGAASESDFHAGMNIASTMGSPTIFFCRNNLWAISTPSSEQFRGDGIAGRGVALGMHTIRVDGSDVLAVYAATKAARALALSGGGRPVLVEAMTYRESHHSTSDDSTRYRSLEEIDAWRTKSNGVRRTRLYLEGLGLWDAAQEEALLAAEKREVLRIIALVEGKPKVAVDQLFTDVYKDMPPRLAAQEAEMREHIAKFPVAGH